VRFSASHILTLFISVLLLSFFVGFQELAIKSPIFVNLMFFSFIFLGAGTFLTIITFAKSSEAEKFVCSGVAIVFIVATLFVANSLAQVPRGGFVKGIDVIPESFTLTLAIASDGTYEAWSQTQILHSADYPVGSIYVRSSDTRSIRISTQNAVRLDATLIFNLWLLPYDQHAHTSWETISLGHGQWGESYIFVHPREIAIKFEDRGLYNPEYRVRLEGYSIKFRTIMIVYNVDLDFPAVLDFTFDMSNFPFRISYVMVDSKFQNGLGITLSGIFIGINCCIPGKLLSELPFKKTRLQNQKL